MDSVRAPHNPQFPRSLRQTPHQARKSGLVQAYASRRTVNLTTLPSSALLAMDSTIASHGPPGPPILLGYPGKAERRLAVVEDEIAALARLFPQGRAEAAATHADLTWKRAPSILHLAAHGQIHQQC